MVTSYDPKKVNASMDGTTLTGFTSDGIITVSKSEDAIMPNVGIQGGVIYEENANESGTVAVILQQTSLSLQKLKNPASNRKRSVLTVSDVNDDVSANVSGSECRILKEPGVVEGKNTSTVTVDIYVPNLKTRQ